MGLKIQDLAKINSEFQEIYEEMFASAYKRNKLFTKFKREAINKVSELRTQQFKLENIGSSEAI